MTVLCKRKQKTYTSNIDVLFFVVRPYTMFYNTRPHRPKQIDRDVSLDSKALEKKDQTSISK